MNAPFQFAIIGYGHIGERHAQLLHQHSDVELAGIVDVDPDKRKKVEDQYDCPQFEKMEALFSASTPIDVVNICTPNGLHTQHAIQALDNNCHVICEKPMGLSKKSCERVVQKAEEKDKAVCCVTQNRYTPTSKWLKEVVTQHRLGKVYLVQINCYWNRNKAYYDQSEWRGTKKLDGGPLFTQFSHFVDTLYWLFGNIKLLHATFDNFKHPFTEFEDTGLINFSFGDRGKGAFHYSTSAYQQNFESSITILGEKGLVKVGGQYMDKVIHCDVADYSQPHLPKANPPNQYGSIQGSAANHGYVLQNMIDFLKGQDSIDTPGAEGVQVVDIIERIYRHRKA